MDVLTSMTTGSAAGLSVSILLRPVWSGFASRTVPAEQSQWVRTSTRSEALYLGAHLLAGAAQGFLFWLSWGLTALNIMSWWLQGLAVGGAFAMLAVLPLILVCSSVIRMDRKVLWVLGIETLTTCLAVGLACSWHWTQR